jgi:hypothetical protein
VKAVWRCEGRKTRSTRCQYDREEGLPAIGDGSILQKRACRGWRGSDGCATLTGLASPDAAETTLGHRRPLTRFGPIAQWLEQRTHNLADGVLHALVLGCNRLFPKTTLRCTCCPVQRPISGYPLQYPLHPQRFTPGLALASPVTVFCSGLFYFFGTSTPSHSCVPVPLQDSQRLPLTKPAP